jgi:hypothetical protein
LVTTDRRFFAGHRKAWAISGGTLAVLVLVVAVVLVLLDESPAHSVVRTSTPTGIGPGTKVADPPPATVASEHKNNVGRCEVAIRNHYRNDDWGPQTKCASNWGDTAQLVTIKNESTTVPVFVNEWYTGVLHGQTTIMPGQTVIMPVWGALTTSLYLGACWPGTAGPGTCQAGPDNQKAVVHIISFQPVPQGKNDNGLMFIRETNSMGFSSVHGRSYTAMNLGDYPVQLHWAQLGRDTWVDLPLKGRIENIPPGDISGRKAYGTGAVGLVSFVATPHTEGGEFYRMVSPSERGGIPPFAYMTWLNGSWCSVHLENFGPARVILQTWAVPPLVTSAGPDLTLEPGASGVLRMKNALLVTGHVGGGSTGDFTRLKATGWKKCPMTT